MSAALESIQRLRAYRKCCVAGIIEADGEKLKVDVEQISRILETEMFKELHKKYPNFGLRKNKALGSK